MSTYFSINVQNINLDIISMNATQPKLFQVFTIIDGKRRRFHLQRSEQGKLIFEMRSDCPKILLDLENKIEDEILSVYRIEH